MRESLAGAGASASMAGMPGAVGAEPFGAVAQSGLLGALAFLIQTGPAILLVSIGALTLALALQSRRAAILALLLGALLYWGMYRQVSLTVMYATIVLALGAGIVAVVWIRRGYSMPSFQRAAHVTDDDGE